MKKYKVYKRCDEEGFFISITTDEIWDEARDGQILKEFVEAAQARKYALREINSQIRAIGRIRDHVLEMDLE